MKIYTENVNCDICGGPGVARPRDKAFQWLGHKLRHIDPNICATYLAGQREDSESGRFEEYTQDYEI